MDRFTSSSKLDENRLGLQFGKYEILSKLAEGGMGELFLARMNFAGISRKVVLKHIHPNLVQQESLLQMFMDEVRVTAHLNHPNIVQIHDVGQLYGIPYVAMEYIWGKDLSALGTQLYSSDKYSEQVPYTMLAGLFSQFAAGLHHAHTATDFHGRPLNIIHRDISPNNLLVGYNGLVKVVDFGVAKTNFQLHKTQVGRIKGRLSYMAPEQITEKPLTPQTDVFSLGTVLYELTTGKYLFKKTTDLGTVKAIINGPIPLPSSIRPDYPPTLEKIVMRALERRPEKRFSDADEFRQALEMFMYEQQSVCGATQIAEFMEELFLNDKKETATTHYSRDDLALLAYRVSSYDGDLPESGDGLLASLPTGTFQGQEQSVQTVRPYFSEDSDPDISITDIQLEPSTFLLEYIEAEEKRREREKEWRTLGSRTLRNLNFAPVNQKISLFQLLLLGIFMFGGSSLGTWLMLGSSQINAKKASAFQPVGLQHHDILAKAKKQPVKPTPALKAPAKVSPKAQVKDKNSVQLVVASKPQPKVTKRKHRRKRRRYKNIRIQVNTFPQGARVFYGAKRKFIGRSPLLLQRSFRKPVSLYIKKGSYFSSKLVIPKGGGKKHYNVKLRKVNIEMP